VELTPEQASARLAHSPLKYNHAMTARWIKQAMTFHDHLRRDLLYGGRALRWPIMALRTSLDFGPVRHALAQMVVSGEMVVFPPFVKSFPKPKGQADS
jgi:hypothetical protein